MICFVILHYLDSDETKNCVNSILRLDGSKKIIIVDNASPNDSGLELKKEYKSNKDIDVIINKDNLGFAKGNNIGYRYAKDKYNPEYIIVMNNDIEICQIDFIDRIKDIYNKEKYAILSPDIYSTYSKVHQSPKKLKSLTYEEVLKEYKKYSFYNKSKLFIPLKCHIKEIKFLKKFIQNYKFKKKKIDYDKVYYNVPIHGSFIIFSKDYIDNKEDAFYDKTFMYYESEILDYICHRDNLKVVYNPSVKINHHHSISSIKSYKSELKRERFVNRCVCNSLDEFIKLMDSDRGNYNER